MEDTRLPKCVMFGEMVGGAGCVGGQEKKWMGCFLDDLRAFGINDDQWTTAAQDKGEWRRTAEQGAVLGCGSFVRGRKRKKGDSIPFILSRRDYMSRLHDECP